MEDVGKIVLKIDKLSAKYGLSKSKLSREARIQYKQAKSYCEGNMQKVDLVILAKICDVFDCKISDVLEYVPAGKR